MPSYNSTWFQPPAPLTEVVLRNANTGVRWDSVPMLLDTGADVSLVPSTVVERLGLEVDPDRRYELFAFDGSASVAQIVSLDLIFLGRTFRGEFLLSDQKWGILGRNILNAVPILLDGPRLTWDERK